LSDKKDTILSAALSLFAEEGYDAVSTYKIASRAGVSEGLIFRHFENKKGLLEAIVFDVEQRIQQVFAPMLSETSPEEVIRITISIPFHIEPQEYDFWRLQFKLKWQTEYNKPEKMKSVLDKLTWAFRYLHYPAPAMEAQFLLQVLDSVSISILRDGLEPSKKLKNFLLSKYSV
jgi:AcrR family transcriptional regulator